MALDRRTLLRGVGSAALVAPFAVARFAVDDDRPPMRRVGTGDVLTAAQWNALVDRVNELSKAGRL